MSASAAPMSIRGRLTLMYTAAIVVLLGLNAVGVYWFVQGTLFEDLDDQLYADSEYASDMLAWADDGRTLVWRANPQDSDTADSGQWLEAWSLDGRRLLYRSKTAREEPLAKIDPPRAGRSVSVHAASGRRVRLLDRRIGVEGRGLLLRLTRDEEGLHSEVAGVLLALSLGVALGAVLAAGAGYALARRALSPVERMAARASAISAEHLSDRLPVERDDELGRLARVFNATLARLEQSFHQMRQFTSDVSHELRTPLTAVRSVGEVGLQSPRTQKEYEEIIGSMLEEADRLGNLVDTLLVLSRVDAGQTRLAKQPIDLKKLVQDTIQQLHVLVEDKEQDVVSQLDGPMIANVDPLLLRQGIVNLLDNAIKFSPRGSSIQVALSAHDGDAMLMVRDAGPGIPQADQPHVFDRFYRADHGRARDTGGVGLGLAIARSVVEAHAGRITLESIEGQGSTFWILLPLAQS